MRTDLISRCKLFNRLATLPAPAEANTFKAEVYKILQEMETEDRPQGEWIKFGLGRGTRILFCTNCERRIEVPLSQGDSNYDYCPNCGARMKGADDE